MLYKREDSKVAVFIIEVGGGGGGDNYLCIH